MPVVKVRSPDGEVPALISERAVAEAVIGKGEPVHRRACPVVGASAGKVQ